MPIVHHCAPALLDEDLEIAVQSKLDWMIPPRPAHDCVMNWVLVQGRQTSRLSWKKWRSSIAPSLRCSGTKASEFRCGPAPKSDWMMQPAPVTLS